ncbi:unnamed protein product [Sphagnum balticum]
MASFVNNHVTGQNHAANLPQSHPTPPHTPENEVLPVVQPYPPTMPRPTFFERQLVERQLEFLTLRLTQEILEHNSTRGMLQDYLSRYLKAERSSCYEKTWTAYVSNLIHELQIEIKQEKTKNIELEKKLAENAVLNTAPCRLEQLAELAEKKGRNTSTVLQLPSPEDFALENSGFESPENDKSGCKRKLSFGDGESSSHSRKRRRY